MEQQAGQQNETKGEGRSAKYVRLVVTILGIGILLVIVVMAVYRKFVG